MKSSSMKWAEHVTPHGGEMHRNIFMGKPGFWKGNPGMEATWKSRRGCEGMSRKSVQGKWDVKTWLGLIWRRRGIVFGADLDRVRKIGFHKMRRISRMIVELQASQEGLCLMM